MRERIRRRALLGTPGSIERSCAEVSARMLVAFSHSPMTSSTSEVAAVMAAAVAEAGGQLRNSGG